MMMEDISLYSKRALVGHARGRHVSVGFLIKWVLTQWGSIVSTPCEISRLEKGWVLFILSSQEEVDLLVKRI